MNRRNFLQKTAVGTIALAFPEMPVFFKEMRMGVVVHSYGIRWNSKIESKSYPGFTNAIDLINHCHRIGAGGVQVVVNNWSADFAKKVRTQREKLNLYMEGSISLPRKTEDISKFEQDVQHAKEAGATILRTVSLGGRRYETFKSQREWDAFKKSALIPLQIAEPVLKKYKVKLAVENHKDWLAGELANMLKQLNSEWVGVTLDFGNSIALMEDPMEVVRTLAPFVFSTHVKDMAMEEYADGFLLSEVPLGTGILNLKEIVALCKQHNPQVTFNLEMITRDPLEIPCLKEEYWSTFEGRPPTELARTLRLARQSNKKVALPRVSQLSNEEKLAAEEKNILACLDYSTNTLGLK